jgi:hypothetical protein
MKARRFGYKSNWHGRLPTNNLEAIRHEMRDVDTAMTEYDDWLKGQE